MRKRHKAQSLGTFVLTVFIILLFLTGVSIFSFPYISDYFHTKAQTKVIESFNEALNDIDDVRINAILTEAREYNLSLSNNPQQFHLSESELAEYHNLFRLNEIDDGMIGTLEINDLGIKLPIYKGIEDSKLRVGLGHIPGTSLPVGDAGTHTVITGHRGLHTASLLTNIDRMDIGDVFILNILNLRLYYMTDQIEVVLPDDFSQIAIDPDMDYATLLTCTPIGINSHRLLVRGVRIPDEQINEIMITIKDDCNIMFYLRVSALILSLLILMILMLIFITRKKDNRNRNDHK